MSLDTFEERQAYIDKCWLEIREAEARSARMKHDMAVFDIHMQAFHAVLQAHLAQQAILIYRGMFDPTFCAPSTGDASEEQK